MQKVIIKNLGPIQEAEIDLKPFVVIIGKSGSGKSVLLRTISLLKWLYKQEQIKSFSEPKLFDVIEQEEFNEYFKESMLNIYVNEKTEIVFIDNKTPIIEIKDKNIIIHKTNIDSKKLIGKIIFLNDIRNFLPEYFVNPKQRQIQLSYHTNDMIENFIKSATRGPEKIKLNTMKDITFTSETQIGFNRYYLEHNNVKIPFEQSSSGEKSAIVVELICNYFSRDYKFKAPSGDKIDLGNLLLSILGQKVETSSFNKNEVIKQLNSIKKPKNSKYSLDIFIEEPESNLFPSNQKDMAYYLSSLRNAKNSPNIIFSTHSPYILTALNNILYASIIEKKLQDNKNDIYRIVDKESIMDYKDLIAYKLENGKSKSIMNKKTKLIDAEYIDIASEEIMSDFYKIAELDND